MKNSHKEKINKRIRRHARVRAKINGTKDRPRFSVAKSIKHIFAQLIDDINGRTLASASDYSLDSGKAGKRKRTVAGSAEEQGKKSKKIEIAYEVGKLMAEKAKKIGVEAVVFDRGGYRYHGRIKAVGEGAKDGGLKF